MKNKFKKGSRVPGSSPNPAKTKTRKLGNEVDEARNELNKTMQELANLAQKVYRTAEVQQETRLLAAAHFSVIMKKLEEVCEKVGVEIPFPEDFDPVDDDGKEIEVESRLALQASFEFRKLAEDHNRETVERQKVFREQMVEKLRQYKEENGHDHPMAKDFPELNEEPEQVLETSGDSEEQP